MRLLRNTKWEGCSCFSFFFYSFVSLVFYFPSFFPTLPFILTLSALLLEWNFCPCAENSRFHPCIRFPDTVHSNRIYYIYVIIIIIYCWECFIWVLWECCRYLGFYQTINDRDSVQLRGSGCLYLYCCPSFLGYCFLGTTYIWYWLVSASCCTAEFPLLIRLVTSWIQLITSDHF